MKKIRYIFLFMILFTFSNVNAAPSNSNFIDDNFYSCIIDAYNSTFNKNVDVSYSILPEELVQIKTLDCSNYSGKIENLTGLNKLYGLTSINLSGNTFLGGSLKLTTSSGSLRSNINLPSGLSITDKTYKIDDTKVVKMDGDKVYPLEAGSTTITMTGKITGNTIVEKYLITVVGGTIRKSNNSKLSSLYLSNGEFSFDSDVKTYATVVDNSVDKVTINATLSDKKSSFVQGYGPRTEKLNIGENRLEVKVKAEDDSESSYIINVIRSDGNDRNDRLVNIELSVGKINFDPDTYNYNFTVASNVDEIDVKGVSESTLAKVYVSDILGSEKEDKITSKLKVGTNKIIIRVVSESNNEKKYSLIITREDYDSNDNYLSNIVINNYNINFSRNKFNYDLNIKNEKTLTINPVLENNESTFVINGNENLKNDSKITINVSDKEGSTRIYTINIHKSFDIDNTLIKLILIGIEFIIIIVLLIILAIRSSKKPRKPKKVRPVKKPKNNAPKKIVGNNITCKSCGTVNDSRSKTCYVCGNEL